ncbi:flippase [Cellulophaga sp. L1A9]|uniref:flippase n=1 Tax=Cellulophaga sp. L1A9 TaxID=2686362 RepID=UPI00131BD94D|nr:flippase [Cellulophaga sp. L1A9]
MSETKKTYFFNSAWMLAEKLIRMIAAILTSILFARYLGPSQFGNLNYAIAFVSIFIPFSEFGMSSILVRDYIIHKNKKKIILGTSFYLLLLFSFLSFVVLNIINLTIDEDQTISYWILLYSFILFAKPLDVIDFYFQSEVKAKISSICKTISILITLLLKFIIVAFNFPIIYIVYVLVLEFILLALFYLITFWKIENIKFTKYFDLKIFKDLIRSAWPIVLSALSVILYMRIDQIMLKQMVSAEELGLYSSAIRIYEGYVSLIIVVSLSMMPAILALKHKSEKEYTAGFTKLFSYVFWGNNLIALIMTFIGPILITFLYGEEYNGAQLVFSIIFWASSFASLGSVTARYLIVEKKEKKQATRTIVALTCNILLNLIIIPKYGKEGAAITTIISLFIGNYLIDYFDKDLKKLLRIKNNAIRFNFK